MYEANKNLLPKDVQNLFVHRYGHVHSRQTGNFKLLDVGTTKKQMCISIDGPNLWNFMEAIHKRQQVCICLDVNIKKLLWNLTEKKFIDLLLIYGTKIILEFS